MAQRGSAATEVLASIIEGRSREATVNSRESIVVSLDRPGVQRRGSHQNGHPTSFREKKDLFASSTIQLIDGRFYCRQENGENLEAPLMAEGLRKIGTLIWLVLNGSLMDRCILCWDEPEANMNPRLVALLRDTLLALVGEGAQSFVATHDYLFPSELSIASEYAKDDPPCLTRFLSLVRGKAGVTVESAKLFHEISDNAILVAFGEHHDRRRA